MASRGMAGWLGVVLVWLASAPAWAGPEPAPPAAATAAFPAARVPLEELAPGVRERVAKLLEQPTLSARGQAEAFYCRPAVYYWLLEHPDLAVRIWRLLGAQCTDISNEGDGRFGWHDPQAGDLQWETVYRGPRMRVWYAEGRVKPSPLLPSSAVQAAVVLHYAEGSDPDGKPAVRHQMDLILHTDSRALALAARLMGGSAPRLAEQAIGQMEMFFGALAWYLSAHPEKARSLFEQTSRPADAGATGSRTRGRP
jgi:hypothetical protein